ncbi:MAG: hypothetical protein E7013_04560 [Alphaproteobacteria bacterium]|nr:hypothetical protein [Alphaproteobacteria bacterium]
MKKILLLTVFLVSGCSITLFIDNENCLGMDKFEVFQTLDDGALAYECTFDNGCSPFNQIVFLEEQRGVDYYDGLIINTPKGKCSVQHGVYKYTTKQETRKTVPVINFEYKNNPKSEAELIERLEENREDVYYACLKEIKDDNSIEDKTKLCECFSNSFMDYTVEQLYQVHNKQSNKDEKENLVESDTKEKVIKNIENKCGKLPKSLLP